MNRLVLLIFMFWFAVLKTSAQNHVWSVDKVVVDTVNFSGNQFQVRQLDPTIGFELVWASEPAQWSDLATGDADNDGQIELLMCSDHHLCIYKQSGGSLRVVELPYMMYVQNVLIRDADNDSLNEVVVKGKRLAYQLTLIYKCENGTYLLKTVFRDSGDFYIDIADADNDGQNELVYGSTDSILIYSYSGAMNQFTRKFIIQSSMINDIVIARDVDNDGLNEIVAGGSFSAVRVWRIVNGVVTTLGEHTVSGYSQGIAVGDVNGDSKNELVVGTASMTYGDVSIFSFADGVFTQQWYRKLNFNVAIPGLEIGDSDNDGINELAVWGGGPTTSRIVKFANNAYDTLAVNLPSQTIVMGQFDFHAAWGPSIVLLGSKVNTRDSVVQISNLRVKNYGAGTGPFAATFSVHDLNVTNVEGTGSFPGLGYLEESSTDSTQTCRVVLNSQSPSGIVTVQVDFMAGETRIGGGEIPFGLVSQELVQVDGGTFQMGATTGDMDELPIHAVSVGTYKIDKYEVTYEQWQSLRTWALSHGYTDLSAGESGYEPVGTSNPVTQISWYDALKFCNARSEMEGLPPLYYTDSTMTTVYRTGQPRLAAAAVKWNVNGYRLPTEAEWEYAAQGGRKYVANSFSGSNICDTVAWYAPTSGGSTHPVGTKKANELELHDMSGNVYEWCWDWYGPYSPLAQADPRGLPSGMYRVCRGGSYFDGEYNCRVSYRNAYFADWSFEYVGLRCVQGVNSTGAVGSTTQGIPLKFALSQNYPNPFNPTTTIAYALPHRSRTTLTVYNTVGQKVTTLVNGEIEAGYHAVRFDASGLASGVYFYRLQAGDFVQVRKLLLVR